jgi:hypothetical protein
VILVGVALAGRAAAQTFPPANAYVPFTCGGGPMTDAAGDTPNAVGALDIVGSNAQPAAFHAADAQFLFLRMRLAATPLAGNVLVAGAWGFEFDLDGDRRTYELLLSVSGNAVAIYRHPTTAVLDDPADPSVTPPAFSYMFATHASSSAASSTLGGATDAFIDVAVPWTDLATVGVQRDTPVSVWAGTSTVPNALDLDLACFGGAGGHLSGIDIGATTPDPNGGGGGTGGTGGGGGSGSGGRMLEGGLGCSVAPRAATPSLLLLCVCLAALGARRYFRSSR